MSMSQEVIRYLMCGFAGYGVAMVSTAVCELCQTLRRLPAASDGVQVTITGMDRRRLRSLTFHPPDSSEPRHIIG